MWDPSGQNQLGFTNSQVYHIDLGETVEFDGFDYAPRQSTSNPDILNQYEIYVTEDALSRELAENSQYLYVYGFNGHTPVASGNMEATPAVTQRVVFDAPVRGRHFYIRALSASNGAGGSSTAFSISELNLIREILPEGMIRWLELPGTKFNTEGAWSIRNYCCEATSGESTNGLANLLIDDNINTYYHSNWASAPTHTTKHGFVVDFGETMTVGGFVWVPRQTENANNGRWTKYRVWFFDNESDIPTLGATDDYDSYSSSNTPDAEGNLSATAGGSAETALFAAPHSGRYMLVIPDGAGNFSCAAEIGIVTVNNKAKYALRSEYVAPYVERINSMRNYLPGINDLLDGILADIENAAAISEVHDICTNLDQTLTECVNTLVAGYIAKNTALTCLLYTYPRPRDISGSRMPYSS